MTPQSERYHTLLTTSADQLVWAVGQIPYGRYTVLPLPAFGAWPVVRLMYHVIWHEQSIMVPYLRHWAGQPPPDFTGMQDDQEEQDWRQTDQAMVSLLSAFHQGQATQADLIMQMPEDAWTMSLDTVYGTLPLKWLVAKAYQLRIETLNQFLHMALHWDLDLQDQKNARLAEGRKKDNEW
jgi:hypothetical protein